MKVIEMNVDELGYNIHALAEKAARDAKEPVKVKMIFHGGNVFYRYSDAVATEGTPEEALEMLEHLLNTHDRYYDYSDDHRVWQKGVAEWCRINAVLKTLKARGIDYSEIYEKWKTA